MLENTHIRSATEEREERVDSAGDAARFYAVGFVVVPLLALVFTVFASTQPWFLSHDNYDFFRVTGYGIRQRGSDCKILIYGDSTAMAGLNPSILEQATGLKTCNIAELRPVEDFVGVDFPLQEYLAHNARPEYLLTSWAPPTLDFNHGRVLSARQDGYLYALQYDRGPWLWAAMLTHPSQSLSFLNWAMSGMLEDAGERLAASMHSAKTKPDRRTQRDSHEGMFTFTNVPEKRCSKPDPPPATTYEANQSATRDFRERYNTKGMTVVVNVSPIASCMPNLEQARRLTEGIVDNHFATLPIGYFDVDNTHLTEAGSSLYSQAAAQQISALMAAKGKDAPSAATPGGRTQ